MVVSKIIVLFNMKLRSGFQHGNSNDSMECQTMVPVEEESDDSNHYSEDDRVVQNFTSINPTMGHSSLQRFQRPFNRVATFLRGFKSVLVRVVMMTPTIIGVIGGLLSAWNYCAENSKEVKLFIDIDGELFSNSNFNKVNQTV